MILAATEACLVVNELKIFLTRFRAARWLANLKNGTLRMLRQGYQPRRFWDEWADRFSRQPYQRQLHESNLWLLDRLRESHPDEILEIGCGFGRNLKMLQTGLGSPCRLVGVDLSLQLLRKAREELGSTVPLLCGDIGRLPFPDKSFRTVVTHGVLMHVPPEHVRSAVAELVRVTDGTLWCIEEQVLMPQGRGRSFSINDYTFAHDYPALFAELGIRLARVDHLGKAVVVALMRIDTVPRPADAGS
jgi:SAM-dependent methyltransferase